MICCAALIALQQTPTTTLLYVMVVAQGALGYGYTSVMGPIVAEIFHGRHDGTIFGTVMLLMIGGGAVGPRLTGAIYDATGSYAIGFSVAAGLSVVSAVAIWFAAPRKVRAVAGQIERPARARAG